MGSVNTPGGELGFIDDLTATNTVVFRRFFKKRPHIQRAERWSPRARGEISRAGGVVEPLRRLARMRHFFFAKLFSLGLLHQRKKRIKEQNMPM